MIATHLFALLLVSASAPFVHSTSTSAKSKSTDSANIFALAYPIVAYVLESEKNVATTYLVACPASIPTTSCPFNQPYTLIEGPKTVQWSYIASEQRLTVDCTLQGTTSMGCRATGRAGSSGPVTKEAYTWEGAKASTLFRDVELITDSKSLMTHTVFVDATSTSSSSSTSTPAPAPAPSHAHAVDHQQKHETKVARSTSACTKASYTASISPNTNSFGAVFAESSSNVLVSKLAATTTSRLSVVSTTSSTSLPTISANSGLASYGSSRLCTTIASLLTILVLVGV